MYWLGVPSSEALMKSPTAGMKVSSEPAKIPGRARGSVTLRKAAPPCRNRLMVPSSNPACSPKNVAWAAPRLSLIDFMLSAMSDQISTWDLVRSKPFPPAAWISSKGWRRAPSPRTLISWIPCERRLNEAAAASAEPPPRSTALAIAAMSAGASPRLPASRPNAASAAVIWLTNDEIPAPAVNSAASFRKLRISVSRD